MKFLSLASIHFNHYFRFSGKFYILMIKRSTPSTIERFENPNSGKNRIVTACSDRSVRIISPVSGNTILTLFPSDRDLKLKQISYNMDCDRLFYLCTNGDIILYDTSTSPGRIIEILESSQFYRISCLFSISNNMDSSELSCFRGNSFRLIVGTDDGQIIILFNGKTETYVQVFEIIYFLGTSRKSPSDFS